MSEALGLPLAAVDALPHAELLLHAAYSQWQADRMKEEMDKARDRS